MATDPNVVLFYALRSLQSRLDRIVRRLCLVGQTVDVCSAETRKDAWDPRVDVGEFPCDRVSMMRDYSRGYLIVQTVTPGQLSRQI